MTQMALSPDEFDISQLAPLALPRNAPHGAPLEAELIGEISGEDLVQLQRARTPDGAIRRLRYSHHAIARRFALGDNPAKIALATGYSLAYISSLQDDPTFKELLVYYANQAQEMFIDTAERLKNLGVAAVEELQSRIDDKPEEWARRELMELAELALVKPLAAQARFGSGASGPAGGVSVNVQFVSAPQSADAGPTIDVTPRAREQQTNEA